MEPSFWRDEMGRVWGLPEFGSCRTGQALPSVAALAGAKKDNFLSSLKLIVHKVTV